MPPKKKKAAEVDAEAREAMFVWIRETLVGWYPGKWAEEVALKLGPACHCGVWGAKEPCTRHGANQKEST